MPPIPKDEMGDVSPAVAPGHGPKDLGSATLTPTAPCEVRSFQTLSVTYTVGRFGLDDTGAIRVAFRWVNDCGSLQTDDAAAMNYVTARASNGVPLTVFVEPYGYRPWSRAVRVTVTGGFMRPGDTIEVVFGDRCGGGPGMRMQTIAEAAFELKVSVDACATGQFSPLDDELHLPVVAGPPEAWKIVAPTRRRPGEPFRIGIKAEDAWGNPALPGPADLRIQTDMSVDGLPESLTFPADERAVSVEGLSVSETGATQFHLGDADGNLLATSAPLIIQDGPDATFWGDLHGQSGETVGTGTIEEYLGFARDIAFLDVSGHQGNDFQITDAFWQKINAVTAAMDDPGHFVVFPGYEWSGNTPVGGDHNVFFRHEGNPIRRSSHAMLADRTDLGTDTFTLDALFEALTGEDCVVWAHVGGRPADVAYAHDPALKTAVEVHSNWGTFEWILTDSLALGHRVGVVANSDGHKGRPGAGPPGATEFGAYGGLTCFLAPELTRDAIFESLRRRHHYGTSGARLDLKVVARFTRPAAIYPRDPRHFDVAPAEADHAIMGDIARVTDDAVTLDIRVAASAPVERLDVMDGAKPVATLRTYEAPDLGNRVRVYWQGAEYRGRGRNSLWQGTIRVEGAAIRAMTPLNQWNPERRLELTDPHTVTFEAVTSGNFAGVDLGLDGAGRIIVDTNHVRGHARLGDLDLEDAVLDAGGLERQIRIRRLPDALNKTMLDRSVTVPLAAGAEAALWARLTTLDGHQAWSSPIYLWRD
ncbi:MAG: DUF3604 domain-containing protein [Paracoccaceae bacterium]|nr:DUF3604 domain-containing protein [Paracoccaceae bacterium]